MRARIRLRISVALIGLVLATIHAHAQSNYPRQDLWVPSAGVKAAAISGDTLYLAGTFLRLGPIARGGFAVFDNRSARLRSKPAEVRGDVFALVPDGAGGWYAGGNFDYVDSTETPNLVHLRADGSRDDGFQPNPNYAVYGLALVENTLYIAGGFRAIGNTPRDRLAAVDARTGQVLPWNPGADGTATCLAVAGNMVYVGGGFSHIGGEPHARLAALDPLTGLPTSWSTQGANGAVFALAVADDTLYAAGTFTSINGEARQYIAELRLSDGTPTPWRPSLDGPAKCVTRANGVVYTGGRFTQVDGVEHRDIVALDAATGLALDWAPAVENKDKDVLVNAIAVVEDHVVLAGDFTKVGGLNRGCVAAVDPLSGEPTPWQADAGRAVNVLSLADSAIAIGGAYSFIGGAQRNGLGALDLRTGRPTDWYPRLANFEQGVEVLGMSLLEDVLYIGGSFIEVEGLPRSGLAAIDVGTGAVLPWDPSVRGVPLDEGNLQCEFDDCWPTETYVDSLLAANGVVYATGTFSVIGGVLRQSLAAIVPGGGEITEWDPGYQFGYLNQGYAAIYALVADAGGAYAGGTFRSIGGAPRSNLAEVDLLGGSATVWDPNPDATVYALALSEDLMFAGGSFETISGGAHPYLAAIARDTGAALDWTSNPDWWVKALSLLNGTLYVGGGFSKLGDTPRNRLAALDATTGQVLDWNPQTAQATVTNLLATEDAVMAMGDFRLSASSAPVGMLYFPVGASAPHPARITPSTVATNQDTIAFQVIFSEPVVHFDDEGDIYVMHNGTAHEGVTIAGAGDTYTVTFTGLSGEGLLSIAIRTDSDVTNAEGTPLAYTFDSDPVRLDHTGPRVTRIVGGAVTDRATSIPFYVTFDEPTEGFDAADDVIVMEHGTTHNGISVAPFDGLHHFNVEGVQGFGDFTVAVNLDSDVRDLAGNPLVSTLTSAPYAIDHRPKAISIVPNSVGPTAATQISFSIQFNTPVQHFNDASDVCIEHEGTANTGIAIAGSDDFYQVTVSGLTGNGTFTLQVCGDSDVQDLVGNPMGTSVTSAPVFIRHGGPSVLSVVGATAGPEEDGSMHFAIQFSEPVLHFDDASDLVVTHFGTYHALAEIFGSGDTYTVVLAGIAGRGIFTLGVRADSDIANGAGLPLKATTTSAAIMVGDTDIHEGGYDLEGEGSATIPHSADTNGDYRLGLSELLRCVQFYNSGAFTCATAGATEDGYQPGLGSVHACRPHDADFEVQDWRISLHELLRLIQIYNSESYLACPAANTEDGFCV